MKRLIEENADLIAKGFRDLYWCSLLNEPVIMEYRGNLLFCVNCETEPIIKGKYKNHYFMFHIKRPKGV